MPKDAATPSAASPESMRRLSWFDSVCLIVGIIVGAGIFEASAAIAGNSPNLTWLFGLWIAGGLLSVMGAFCYAELGSTYPRAGGDYNYLSRAYGPWAGILFGWMQTAVIRPGDIAVMAFVFANYAAPMVASGAGQWLNTSLALGAVILLTLVNIAGVQLSKNTQNVLTVIKVVGLFIVFVVALSTTSEEVVAPPLVDWNKMDIGFAMILILFSFGGWNEMAFVAAEVKNPERNIARSLLTGIAVVTVLYLLVTVAFVSVLGHEGLAASDAVGRDVIAQAWPVNGPALMSGLIIVAALGSTNGLIFAGSRITYAIGCDYPRVAALGRWNAETGTPIFSLALQGFLACTLILVLREFTRALMFTAAPVYCFYLFTSISVIVLRYRDPDVKRPFRVPGYPVVPIVFATCSGYMIYRAVDYQPWQAGVALLIAALGIPVYFWVRPRK
jgi:APA family basic amino acid/polyamine antiporter